MYDDPLPAPTKLKPFADGVKIEQAAGIWSMQENNAIKDEESLTQALLEPLFKDPDLGAITDKKELADLPESAVPYTGGETEALARLEHYFKGGKNAPAAAYKETRNGMLGPDYSTKFASALAHGTISPRLVAQKAEKLDEENGVHGKGGGYWIVFELLWRDYFFFVGKK